MGDGTDKSPYTREDILRLIKENGDKAEGLDLSGKIFVESLDLSNVDLSGITLKNARLYRANFNGSNLDRAILQNSYLGYATFNPSGSKVASLQGVDFRNSNLHDAQFRQADLTASQFQKILFPGVISDPNLQGKLLQLLPASLERTDFRGADLFRANFTGCYFYGTKFEGAFIRGADITIEDTHLGDADWGNYQIGEEAGEKSKRDYYAAEHRYRHLKMWYNNSGYYDIAAKFYYREKESIRKHLRLSSKNWRQYIGLQIMRMLCGYGEKWVRILLWIVGFLLGFAMLYFFFRGVSPNMLDVQTFTASLYFSAVSFISLGYGSWFDNDSVRGWARAVGVFEAFVGFGMMTLLLVTFVRKWTR